tara:strand:- start:6593 stop:11113 length:4521 start_codon:yes stop_codon:yes gene_type:complete
MIKGNIEIFQSYGNTNKSLYKGSNMVVDGFRKTVADVMTHMPNPSGGAQMELGASSVSSYQIQAMTLGSSKEGYSQRDSRFWYSGMATSASNYQLMPVSDNDTFEMWDCYSSIAFNQWKYDNVVDANLLVNPTLKNGTGWSVSYLHNSSSGVISPMKETFAQGEIDITKFELVAGQRQVTLRQRIPEMKLGGVYTLYTNGKAHNATLDIRVSRGRNDVPLEYYDFNTGKFTGLDKNNTNLAHTVKLANYYDVDEFRFQLQGNERDQAFQPNNQYFVEYIFPSLGFIDESFAPWDFNYINPYINIVRLEVCDERHQILRNPNFLEHQSVLMNNDFTILAKFNDTQAKNPEACSQAGLFQTQGWRQLNPLVRISNDPGNRETGLSGFGTIIPLKTDSDAIKANQTAGVAIFASSIELDSSGAALIEQTFNLGRDFRNPFAFAHENAQNALLQGKGNGQYDNNKTLMLSFNTMVSGEAVAADCGTLQVTLSRNSDGFQYNFEANEFTLENDMWTPLGSPYKVSYNTKNVWSQRGAQIILPAQGHEETYTISITGTGRTDGTNGFCYYLLKNVSLGAIAGWRTYVYDQSGISRWSLSSMNARVTPGHIFSGLTLSAVRYSTLADTGSAYTNIRDSINNINVPAKTQLVQNFVGLEPTKTYRVAVKGTAADANLLPGFQYSLKAKARTTPGTNNYNILSLAMVEAWSYSATNLPSNLNPYSTNTLAHRATHPFFSKELNSRTSTPLDWGLYVTASGSSPASSITSEDIRANPGDYTLSMKVFNSHESPSYFALSSTIGGQATGQTTPVFFNWETQSWDQIITGLVPEYRNSTSGAYFLPLPAGANTTDFTTYTYPHPVTLPGEANSPLNIFEDVHYEDGVSRRGVYRLRAAVYGPNAETGSTQITDLALKGPGLGPQVDIYKELYYNFDGASWDPQPTQATDFFGGSTPLNSFMSTPTSLITGMCLYGLDRDTEYQLNIIDTSGGIYTIHDISLQDVSLVCNSGRSRWIRDASKWTSEPYGNLQYTEYNNGTVIKLANKNSGTNILSNTTSPSAMTSWLTPQTVGFTATSGNTGMSSTAALVPAIKVVQPTTAFGTWLTQNFTLGEYNLKGGDNFAVGLEAITNSTGASNTTLKMAVTAMYDGVTYTYSRSGNWSIGREPSFENFTLYSRGPQQPDEFYSDAKTWNQVLSPVIVAPTFGPTTKITVSFTINTTALRNIDVKEFKVYKWTGTPPSAYHVSGPTFNFPEFPSPADPTLQSVQTSGSPGQLGQFLNRINFFKYTPAKLRSQATATDPDVSGLRAINNPMSPSITGEKTLEEAVTMGAFLPSAGLFFGSGTYGLTNTDQLWGLAPSGGLVTGVLNQMGVVNSDGYIYRHPHPSTNTDARDASAGFLVSSFLSDPANTYSHKTLRYILKLHKDDWRFLDYYMGGLGALGLNTLDYKKSYKKLGTAWQLSGTGATYDGTTRVGLYKIADPSRNPVFNLTNKKVTFPPGLKIDYRTTDYITIIWDINY